MYFNLRFLGLNSSEHFSKSSRNISGKYCGLFQVQYKLLSSDNSPTTGRNFRVKRGTVKSCVSQAGTYEFTPVGCHGYPQTSVRWNSMAAANSSVQLMAVAHTMGGRVLSTENVKDIFINVLSTEDQKLKARLGYSIHIILKLSRDEDIQIRTPDSNFPSYTSFYTRKAIVIKKLSIIELYLSIICTT